jgi:hypothetical protein
MPKCPLCNTPGAYVGFSSVECRNPKCTNYVQAMESLCPCCGVAGHTPSEDSVDNSVQVDYVDPSLPNTVAQPGYGGPGFNGEPVNYHADPAHYGADPSSGSYGPTSGNYSPSPVDPDAAVAQDPAYSYAPPSQDPS